MNGEKGIPYERSRRHVLEREDLYVWVSELDLREMPEHEFPGAFVVIALRVVVDGEYSYSVFEHDFTGFQVLDGPPYGSCAFHERHGSKRVFLTGRLKNIMNITVPFKSKKKHTPSCVNIVLSLFVHRRYRHLINSCYGYQPVMAANTAPQ